VRARADINMWDEVAVSTVIMQAEIQTFRGILEILTLNFISINIKLLKKDIIKYSTPLLKLIEKLVIYQFL